MHLKKSLDEYVDLFVNYKLKVAAAMDAQLDTVAAFQKEVADYRSQQAEEYLIDSAFIEEQARNTYEATARNIGPDGMFKAAHILIHLDQQASILKQAQTLQKLHRNIHKIQVLLAKVVCCLGSSRDNCSKNLRW